MTHYLVIIRKCFCPFWIKADIEIIILSNTTQKQKKVSVKKQINLVKNIKNTSSKHNDMSLNSIYINWKVSSMNEIYLAVWGNSEFATNMTSNAKL